MPYSFQIFVLTIQSTIYCWNGVCVASEQLNLSTCRRQRLRIADEQDNEIESRYGREKSKGQHGERLRIWDVRCAVIKREQGHRINKKSESQLGLSKIHLFIILHVNLSPCKHSTIKFWVSVKTSFKITAYSNDFSSGCRLTRVCH